MAPKAHSPLESCATHLLHRACQRATDIFAEEAQKSGLTPRQFVVLKAVSHEENLTQAELVERTGIDRSTLADIVARLLGRGLIQRRRAKHDARAYAIKLSASGSKALQRTQPVADATNSRLLDDLTPTKRQDLLESLNMIVGKKND